MVNSSRTRWRSLPASGARYLPLLVAIGLLTYLALSNSRSEVYVDLQTTSLTFSLAESDELMSGACFDSILLLNWDLRVKSAKLDWISDDRMEWVGPLDTQKREPDVDSHLAVSDVDQLVLRTVMVPSGSRVTLRRDEGSVQIDLQQILPNADRPTAEIDAGSHFLLMGRNIKINSGQEYSDYETIRVSPGPLSKTLFLWANSANQTLVLHPQNVTTEEDLAGDLVVTNVSFVNFDFSKRWNAERSAILKGVIQIVGIDMFGKRFLLKQEDVGEREYIDLVDADKYFITSVSPSLEGFTVSLHAEQATGLATGKRPRLLRSVFPSLLDVLIAEPSKKTLWTVLCFLMTQYTVMTRHVGVWFRSGRED